ncbi:ROK family transcriptional regulator [Frigoribacterium faeni]|uniref:ROK family transcriptional regulator n=1 Tax=Frigoribacterium faeni TaxID=145483 RepID=UPI002413C228|nr:ROK family transcriptional regulator [Frigoribacterium faeni]
MTSVTEAVAPLQARPRLLRADAKADPQDSRQHNRAYVLQMLFREEGLSRADLARRSGLTRPTISSVVADLAKTGLVVELGPSEEVRVGKPGTRVGINSDAFHIIALDLSSSETFVAAILDLRGQVLDRREIDVDGAQGDEAVELAIRLIEQLAARRTRPLLGIGVGSPGLVDNDGVVHGAVHLSWADMPLAEKLSDTFSLPVMVLNDANAAATGMHAFDAAAGDNMLVVSIGVGVGAGLVIDGEVSRGGGFAAGEIGHVTVDPAGDVCACGRRGCLENDLAVPLMLQRIQQAPADQRDTILSRAGTSLGIILAPIVSALNVPQVVLSGPGDLIDGPLLNATALTLQQRTLPSLTKGLNVRSVDSTQNFVILGGAAAVLSSVLGTG